MSEQSGGQAMTAPKLDLEQSARETARLVCFSDDPQTLTGVAFQIQEFGRRVQEATRAEVVEEMEARILSIKPGSAHFSRMRKELADNVTKKGVFSAGWYAGFDALKKAIPRALLGKGE